jgi:hypothetical protein
VKHRKALAAPMRGAALTLTLGLAVLVLVLGAADPALAHGRGSDATNMRSSILEDPGLPGVTWRVYGGDELLEVTNTSDTEILVLGYELPEPQPYLRVGPDGVFTNANSEATYINQQRQGLVDVPSGLDASDVDWVKVSDGNAYAWHDHRMHYMGLGVPPAVTDQSVETVVVPRWEVFVRYGDAEHVVAGDLVWIPPSSGVPWLLLGLVLAAPALLGLRTKPFHDPAQVDPELHVGPPVDPDQPNRWPGLARPAALVLGAIVALNVTHLIDDLFAMPVTPGTRALAAAQTVLFLAIGAFGTSRAWQGGDGAFTALGVGSGAVLVGQGLLYWAVLSVSQITSLFPDLLARITVGVSIAQALPIGIVAVIGTRRLLPPLPEDPERSPSQAGASELTA